MGFHDVGAIGFRVLAYSALIATLCSCADKGPVLYPIQGTVTVDGKPAARLLVLFYLANDSAPFPSPSTALTDEHGNFTLTTAKQSDGTVAGEYAVAFQWYDVKFNGEGEPVHSGPDKLKGRYGDRKKTPIRATVKAGGNEPLVFNLTR